MRKKEEEAADYKLIKTEEEDTGFNLCIDGDDAQ